MTESNRGAADAELVAGVLRADREAFAAVYDRYGGKLYDFAYSMLRHPEDAADTVADSFVLFAERLPQLRDPDRLRPWLYAIVRSECLRRLKARKRVSFGDDEALMAMADDAKTPDEVAETEALRALVWDAAAGLADRDRALLDLHLRQGLEGADLARAMDVTLANTYVMLNRLKGQVDRSLGALLIARMGRADCDTLDDVLAEWDGSFSPLIRKRVARHIENCTTCEERRRRMVSPWALLAGVPLFAAPATLRDRVLSDTRLVAYEGPVVLAEQPRWNRRRTVAAAAAAVLVLGGGALAFRPDDKADPIDVKVATPPTSAVTGGPTLSPEPSSSATTAPTAAPTASASDAPSSAAPEPGALAVTATAIDLGTSTAAKSFEVLNVGGSPLSFRLRPGVNWIRAGGAGSVAPGESARVRVSASHAALPEGDVSGDLVLTWKGGSARVRVTAREENKPVVGRPSIPANASCDVPITASVSDESGLASVEVRWAGEVGSGSIRLTRVSGSTWRATHRFTVGGTVRFTVTARDTRGNIATGPTLATSVNPCPQ